MATARKLPPLRRRPVNKVGPVREGAHEADREPVALRLADANLLLDVVRHVRERVALSQTALVGISSSRPVKLTGWKLRKLIFFGLSSAN